jgi:hypothetical protein
LTPEIAALLATLDAFRDGVLKKLAGLSEADARRSTVDSGTNIAGLIQHLTFVESKWFEGELAGRKKINGVRSMTVAPAVSLRDLRAHYRAACALSDELIASATDEKKLRRSLLAVIGETARHAGHADIIREQVDGQSGR